MRSGRFQRWCLVGRLIALIGFFGLTACSTAPTLTEVQAQVFTPSCAFSSCHGSIEAGDLNLEEGNSWAELVDVESLDAPGNILVIPGDADASYLMAKIHGDDGIIGDVMPPAGSLTGVQLDMVRDWINAGALND